MLQLWTHLTLSPRVCAGIMYSLLVEKPEGEKQLLTTLINKVGDPHYKIAANVSHLLNKLGNSNDTPHIKIAKHIIVEHKKWYMPVFH